MKTIYSANPKLSSRKVHCAGSGDPAYKGVQAACTHAAFFVPPSARRAPRTPLPSPLPRVNAPIWRWWSFGRAALLRRHPAKRQLRPTMWKQNNRRGAE